MKAREKESSDPVTDFLAEFRGGEEFCDEVEVFESIMDSSGIIIWLDSFQAHQAPGQVRDGDPEDDAGRPRMAVLNSKEDRGDFIPDWKLSS